MFFTWCLTLSLTILICFVNLGCAATLATDEVEALEQIAETLGKKNWNFSVDPCRQDELSWFTPATADDIKKNPVNQVICDCSFNNNTTCHVTRIILKRQSLGGKVPPELFRLPYLIEIDLTRNYLNGTIPREWGTMQQLVNISLLGNRVTGGLPIELANISSLLNLTLDYNQLSGNIPSQFGDFSSLEKLSLISNNLTGELPQSLAKLTKMEDFRISDNKFSGNIPNFIQSWTNLQRLELQGSGLSGPIPSGIASMANLLDLRISDLKGNNESTFPLLSNNSNFKNVILRSCNIIGQLPEDLGKMSDLKILDLSFNKLSGPIPETFSNLQRVDYIYLTGNLLTGRLPTWMLDAGDQIDLSYNNLTTPESTDSNCQPRQLNLFASSKGNTTGIVSCLSRDGCPQMYDSLHINCGGGNYDDKGTPYEEDTASGGPSNFIRSRTNWGFSSTGHFLDNNTDRYFRANTSSIFGKNPQLYKDARVSPLSLSYYGFCLRNGTYTISLHFAEIVFTEDITYKSLGRRIFDVYIQGQQVLKDFNIEDEAGGVNIGIIKTFSADVTNNTLDIRFYWAGRGTTGIPYLGDYGPLISAISVINLEKGNSMSVGTIIGIMIAVLFTVLLVLSIFWWKGCLRPKDALEQDLKGLGQHTGLFTLRQIRAATNNFDPANKIGEGGFGPVYKGRLQSDGTIIAVKQLSSKSKQGNREFVNEIGMISALQHPHLVKLYGCCIEGNQLLLVYEYMENNSLARALFSQEKYQLRLNWTTRHKICIGIARGLAYLHEESRLKIVHRDIKATNVLLDKNLNPKISDFGLAKLDEEDNTHISTRIAGTFGYMAPEYAMRGYLTDKADVYSFGVVLLEIVSGRSNTSIKPKEDNFYLLDWANSLKAEGKLMGLVDPRLELNFNEEEVITTINLALCCTNAVAAERPSMSAAVSILEGRAHIGEFVSDSSVSIYKMKPMEITSQDHVSNSSISVDMPWTSSSKSTSDLYPITLDTDNWKD